MFLVFFGGVGRKRGCLPFLKKLSAWDLENVLRSFHEGLHTFSRIFQSQVPSLSEFYS